MFFSGIFKNNNDLSSVHLNNDEALCGA